MSREPKADFIITESRSWGKGYSSIRPYPLNPRGPSLQEVLTDAGFKPGDVVELRISHATRIIDVPPPGQMRRKRRDPNAKR